MNFVHIGAGAGDLDKSNKFRDGFSEYVKKHSSKVKKIYVVEANKKNIPKLKKSWKKFKNTKILNYAIVPNSSNKKKIKMYYSKDDAPYYQLMSSHYYHVKRYFPESKIDYVLAKTLKITKFLNRYFKDKIIESFSIDIEGDDYFVLMDLNLKEINIKKISFEYLHLNYSQKKKIINKLLSNGYSYNGFGLDHNNIDWFFIKEKCIWNNIIAKFLPYLHRKHYKRLNKLLYKI